MSVSRISPENSESIRIAAAVSRIGGSHAGEAADFFGVTFRWTPRGGIPEETNCSIPLNCRCLSVWGDCDVGQPIMAAAAFQAASLFGEESVLFKNKMPFRGRLPSRLEVRLQP